MQSVIIQNSYVHFQDSVHRHMNQPRWSTVRVELLSLRPSFRTRLVVEPLMLVTLQYHIYICVLSYSKRRRVR